MILKSCIGRFKAMNSDQSKVILNKKLYQEGDSLLEYMDFYGTCYKERYVGLGHVKMFQVVISHRLNYRAVLVKAQVNEKELKKIKLNRQVGQNYGVH